MNTLITGERLKLRRAEMTDLKFIMELQYKPENLKFIVPFSENFHTEIINSDNSKNMDVIIEEIATGAAVGYFMLCELDDIGVEWRHVIIDKKGIGYGRETLKLLMKWSFQVKKFHRGWLDCKTYNERALHLYESCGLKREGLIRECILVNGVYEDLIVLGILDREFRE
ncbi:MAG: GNAT family N-acetyltransferase [Selenomonadaceae bacterium]|nr:GNAT family N-acetyltransferase [Selenomonadaceae bacterium]